jgi:hypothetical protein
MFGKAFFIEKGFYTEGSYFNSSLTTNRRFTPQIRHFGLLF